MQDKDLSGYTSQKETCTRSETCTQRPLATLGLSLIAPLACAFGLRVVSLPAVASQAASNAILVHLRPLIGSFLDAVLQNFRDRHALKLRHPVHDQFVPRVVLVAFALLLGRSTVQRDRIEPPRFAVEVVGERLRPQLVANGGKRVGVDLGLRAGDGPVGSPRWEPRCAGKVTGRSFSRPTLPGALFSNSHALARLSALVGNCGQLSAVAGTVSHSPCGRVCSPALWLPTVSALAVVTAPVRTRLHLRRMRD